MGFYKKILLLGKDGQVGWELQRSLASLGILTSLNRSECDLADPARVQAVLEQHEPEVIVNAAAYTAVDQAESEPAQAKRINVDAVAELALYAREMGSLLVHYSTDYIFDGSKPEAYVEDDLTNPLSVYGKTKLDGEGILEEMRRRRADMVFADVPERGHIPFLDEPESLAALRAFVTAVEGAAP